MFLLFVGPRKQVQQQLAIPVSAHPADSTGYIHAIAASRAANWRRLWEFVRASPPRVFAMKRPAASRDRRNRTPAYAKAQCDFAMRKLALFEQTIDFFDKRGWKHSGDSELSRCGRLRSSRHDCFQSGIQNSPYSGAGSLSSSSRTNTSQCFSSMSMSS